MILKNLGFVFTKFVKKDEAFGNFGTEITFENQKQFSFSINFLFNAKDENDTFTQILQPAFRLMIIGGEHDAVKLCKISANLGWEVHVITSAKDSSEIENIITTHDDLYKAELNFEGLKSLDAKEVQNYIAALKIGYSLISKRNLLTNNDIILIQSELEKNNVIMEPTLATFALTPVFSIFI